MFPLASKLRLRRDSLLGHALQRVKATKDDDVKQNGLHLKNGVQFSTG